MVFSVGPFITCFLSTIFLTVYVYIIINYRQKFFYHYIKWIFVCISFLLIRMLIPVNFPFTITILISKMLPEMTAFLFVDIGLGNIYLFEILIALWIIGAIYNLIFFGWKNKKIYKYFQSFICKEPAVKIKTITNCLEEDALGNIKVAVVPQNMSPAIVGLMNPILVIPEYVQNDTEIHNIIQHEIEHYKNFDLWLKLLIEITVCLNWWNPIAYLMRSQLLLAMEISNDIKVIEDMNAEERLDYAACIVRVAKSMSGYGTNQGCGKMISFIKINADIEVRISFIINEWKNKQKSDNKIICLNFLMLLMVIALNILVVPEAYAPPEDSSFEITPENAYLIKSPNGYELYVDSKYIGDIPEITNSLKDIKIIDYD